MDPVDDIPPTHPIDRDRITRYVTPFRVRCAESGSYSSNLNPRNLESDYYPVYNHTLSDLVNFEFDGAITVAQQFNIWLSKATFDLYKVEKYWFVDDDEDNMEVEELLQDLEEMDVDEIDLSIAGVPPQPISSSPPRASTSGRPKRNVGPPLNRPIDFIISADAVAAINGDTELTDEQIEHALANLEHRQQVADNPSDATEADTSIETVATVPDNKAKNSFPDMLLCHWYAVEVDKPHDQAAVFGWERRARCKVQHQCFPLIMEIKGCPSRFLRGRKLAAKMTSCLELAAGDLYTYVQAYFARDVCAKRVIAMIASGPYWRWTEVERYEVAPLSEKTQPANFLWGSLFVSKLMRAPTFLLTSDASDKELTRMRDEALIPLIEEHHRYPSTMVPNPQRPKKSTDTDSD